MSEPIQITLLGTGTSQGVPVIACPCEVCHSTDPHDRRLRSSVCIETQGKVLVIDTGPDFRYQMLRAGIRHLDAIMFTHNHKDHTAGMDDIRAFNYFQQAPMDIYAEEYVQRSIEQEYPYIFEADPYPGVPTVRMHTITSSPFDIDGIPITPIRAMHYKLPVLGYRIGPFAYITDANWVSPEEIAKLEGVTCLVVNALRKEPHLSHFCLSEAVALIQASRVPRAYLTHVSHQMGLHREVEALLPDHIRIAYDGLKISL